MHMFERSLKDPMSLGNQHNAGLDSILVRIKHARAQKNGARLTKSEICDVISGIVSEKFVEAEAKVLERTPEKFLHPRNACRGENLVLAAGGRLKQLRAIRAFSMAQASLTEDWIDTVWATDSLWDGADDISLQDDLTFLSSLDGIFTAAINGTTSSSGLSTAVGGLLSSLNLSDDVQAEWVTEVAALSVSSSDYWNANLEEWLDQYCEDQSEQMRAPSSSMMALDCDDEGGGESLRAGSMLDGCCEWNDVKGVVIADAVGALGIGVSLPRFSGHAVE
jgi:hypothetical protein